jgi:hypothetical protein
VLTFSTDLFRRGVFAFSTGVYTATRQLSELLGLAAPTRIECSGIDLETARGQLEAEIAEEMADRETDS